ncbi:MAG: protein kinase [Desulfobacteraceae bacterium]|nr:protein kinase [Desulfobacteraceae bacterium]
MSIECPKCHFENPDDILYCGKCATPLPSSEDAPVTATLETPKDELTTGSTFAGRYQIIEVLGRGGMGKVFRALDKKLDEEVALKLIKPDIASDKKTLERFNNELKFARKISHKYVGRMYELMEDKGAHFITMEYVPGQDLRGLIRQTGQLTVGTAISIAKQVSEGLAEAHRLDVIHRDLKPQNIMIDKEGNAKIMDFGIARSLQAKGITREGIAVGTPEYMSPEQAEAKDVDQRADIYSLGVILYEMLTGQRPFEGDTALSIAMKHKSETPWDPRELNPQIPDDLSQLILKCMAKANKDRCQSAGQVFSELIDIEKGMPTTQKEIVRKKPLTSKEITVTLSTKKLFIPALVIIAAAIIGLFLWQPWKAGKTVPFSERDWILITDFKNLTGDEIFDQSLNIALTVNIQQSKYVNVFPRARVKQTLQRMGKEAVDTLDEELGSEVAQREGIKALISCSINQIEDAYTLTASIIDPNTQVTLKTEASQADGKNKVLDALDDLASKIREDLGESLSEIQEQSLALPKATTSSLDALKHYTEALQAERFEEAEALFLKAIELDPDFALAHAELGRRYLTMSRNPLKGQEHFDKALALLGRLTEKEKLWIQAIVPDFLGNREDAIIKYRVYLTKYPDDLEGWFRIGYSNMRIGHYRQAIDAFGKVLEINPESSGSYINIATCYRVLGKLKQAVQNYLKAFEINPKSLLVPNINHEFGFTYVEMGEFQKARETFEKMISEEGGNKARGYRSLALLSMFQGKFSDAIDHLNESILLNKSMNALLSEMRDRLFLASAYRAKGMMDASEEEVRLAYEIREKMYLGPWWLQIIGKVFVRQGGLDKAEDLLKDISDRMNEESRNDRVSFNTLKGEIELAKDHYAEAVELLGVAHNLSEGNYALESLAYAYFKKGDMDKAIEKYEHLVANPNLGWEAQEYWIQAHYQLGKIYEEKGDLKKALEYYKRFLDIWKDADSDIPELDDAKQRLAELKK